MSRYIGTSSDYYNFQVEAMLKEEGVTKFEDLLRNTYASEEASALQNYATNIESAYKESYLKTEDVRKQSRYDISNAYSAYKQAQLNLARNKTLGTGFIQQQNLSLKDSFESLASSFEKTAQEKYFEIKDEYSAFVDKEKNTLLKTQESLEAKREKDREQLKKELTQNAKYYAQIEEVLRNIAGITDENYENYYIESFNDKNEKTYVLNDAARDLFDKIMHDYDGEGFTVKDPADNTKDKHYKFLDDYLFDINPELYDFYSKNQAFVNQWVAGLDATDMSYSKEERLYTMEQKEFENEINKMIENEPDRIISEKMAKELSDLSKQDFNSNLERRNAYEKLKHEYETDPIKKYKVSEEEYKVIDNGFNKDRTYVINGLEYVPDEYTHYDENDKEMIDLTHGDKLFFKVYELNDIVRYNNSYYLVSQNKALRKLIPKPKLKPGF